MSQGPTLELMTWGDKTVRLTYWDWRAGEDVIFILNADSTVDRHTYDDLLNDVLTRVDLPTELLKLNARLEQESAE